MPDIFTSITHLFISVLKKRSILIPLSVDHFNVYRLDVIIIVYLQYSSGQSIIVNIFTSVQTVC